MWRGWRGWRCATTRWRQFRVQLSAVLEHINSLNQVDTSAIPPTAQVGGLHDVARADQPRPSLAGGGGARQRPPARGRSISASRRCWTRRKSNERPHRICLLGRRTRRRRALERGEISAVELTRAHLDRIAAPRPGDPCLPDRHPRNGAGPAAAADARRARGPALGPLDGIPMSLKDMLITEGIRTTAGSRILEQFRAALRTAPSCSACSTRARCCWARPTRTSSPWVPPPRTRPSAPRATPGTRPACRAAAAAARRRRWRRAGPLEPGHRYRRQHPPARVAVRRGRASSRPMAASRAPA